MHNKTTGLRDKNLLLRVNAAITVDVVTPLSQKECLCMPLSTDRDNLCCISHTISLPMFNSLITEGRKGLPRHSSLSTGCFVLNGLCQLCLSLHRQFNKNFYRQVPCRCKKSIVASIKVDFFVESLKIMFLKHDKTRCRF